MAAAELEPHLFHQYLHILKDSLLTDVEVEIFNDNFINLVLIFDCFKIQLMGDDIEFKLELYESGYETITSDSISPAEWELIIKSSLVKSTKDWGDGTSFSTFHNYRLKVSSKYDSSSWPVRADKQKPNSPGPAQDGLVLYLGRQFHDSQCCITIFDPQMAILGEVA